MESALQERRRQVEAARATFDSDRSAASIDEDVVGSWTRCVTQVSVGSTAVPVDTDDVDDRWDRSPIRRAAPDLIAQLGGIAEAEDYVVAVTDASGQIIWSHGGPDMTRRAERVNFVTGGHWDEPSAGTNAPGLALVTGRPETVFSYEHWCEPVHEWVCYAAPVRAPTGEVVGVLDLSSTWQRATPMAQATVENTARLIEQLIAVPAPASTATLDVRLLGHAHLTVGGRPLALPLRHLEILAVLVLRTEVTLDELRYCLYGDRPIQTGTLKAAVSHLRTALDGHVASRPYRLTMPVEADVIRLLDDVRVGHLSSAAESYRGQLLPTSEAPLLVEMRHHLDVTLRGALLRRGQARDLLRYADVHPYDVEVLERACQLATTAGSLLPEIVVRLQVARADG